MSKFRCCEHCGPNGMDKCPDVLAGGHEDLCPVEGCAASTPIDWIAIADDLATAHLNETACNTEHPNCDLLTHYNAAKVAQA